MSKSKHLSWDPDICWNQFMHLHYGNFWLSLMISLFDPMERNWGELKSNSTLKRGGLQEKAFASKVIELKEAENTTAVSHQRFDHIQPLLKGLGEKCWIRRFSWCEPVTPPIDAWKGFGKWVAEQEEKTKLIDGPTKLKITERIIRDSGVKIKNLESRV